MMGSPLIRALLLMAAVSSLSSCLDDSITGTREISISLVADPATVAPDEPVTFSFEATGRDIGAVLVDYGDGTADTLSFPNPIEVADQLVHSYDSPGSYTAVGTVVAVGGRNSDEVVVTVN